MTPTLPVTTTTATTTMTTAKTVNNDNNNNYSNNSSNENNNHDNSIEQWRHIMYKIINISVKSNQTLSRCKMEKDMKKIGDQLHDGKGVLH